MYLVFNSNILLRLKDHSMVIHHRTTNEDDALMQQNSK